MDKYAKAIVGAVVAGLSVLAGLLADGGGISDLTASDWIAVALAALSALGLVWAVPNTPAAPAPGRNAPAPGRNP